MTPTGIIRYYDGYYKVIRQLFFPPVINVFNSDSVFNSDNFRYRIPRAMTQHSNSQLPIIIVTTMIFNKNIYS